MQPIIVNKGCLTSALVLRNVEVDTHQHAFSCEVHVIGNAPAVNPGACFLASWFGAHSAKNGQNAAIGCAARVCKERGASRRSGLDEERNGVEERECCEFEKIFVGPLSSFQNRRMFRQPLRQSQSPIPLCRHLQS